MSDHILAWAAACGLRAEQDEHDNLYIRKPAGKGCENAPSVMLQPHLDMAGDQSANGTFDFARQPGSWAFRSFLTRLVRGRRCPG